MKEKWKTGLKCAAGALAALAVLNLFCAWYYNPTAYEWDEARATDTIRTPGAFTSRATEGFAWMRMDANGYNNAGTPGEDGVSVLMMGSSHTEALNVMQDESASARLNELLAAGGADGMVYNIGISSHSLARCVANLGRALERFQPSDYVVLETQDVELPPASFALAYYDTFERLSATDVPLPDWITGQPLSRALYRQIASLTGGEEGADDSDDSESFELTGENYGDYVDMLCFWLKPVRETAEEHGVEVVIYYHPHLVLQEDGSAVPSTPELYLQAFAEAASRVGITFLDLTQDFLDAYESEHILPHGFVNTAAGEGHLNAEGHEIIARALYEIIQQEGGVGA